MRTESTKEGTAIGYVEPFIKNFEEIKQKARRMQACWSEIERLAQEIQDEEYPIEFQLSWTEK
jgi:hypothetical protein